MYGTYSLAYVCGPSEQVREVRTTNVGLVLIE